MSAASRNTRPYRRSAPPSSGTSPTHRPSPGSSPPLSPTRQTPRSTSEPVPSAVRRPAQRPEPKILYQDYFKSVGTRTYAAQLKEASNGNHFLVLTEGKRDPQTGQVKKISLYIYSEDFAAYFQLLKSAADFIRAHPVPDAVKRRQAAYWKRQGTQGRKNPAK